MLEKSMNSFALLWLFNTQDILVWLLYYNFIVIFYVMNTTFVETILWWKKNPVVKFCSKFILKHIFPLNSFSNLQMELNENKANIMYINISFFYDINIKRGIRKLSQQFHNSKNNNYEVFFYFYFICSSLLYENPRSFSGLEISMMKPSKTGLSLIR